MANIGEIRTVYAVLSDGRQIVRYSRSKRWFLEDASGVRIKRYRSVTQAAAEAVADQQYNGGDVFLSQPEGSYFDKYALGFQNREPVAPIERYTAAGLRQAVKRAQSRYAKELSRWENQKPHYLEYYEREAKRYRDRGYEPMARDFERHAQRLGASWRAQQPKKPNVLKRHAS